MWIKDISTMMIIMIIIAASTKPQDSHPLNWIDGIAVIDDKWNTLFWPLAAVTATTIIINCPLI